MKDRNRFASWILCSVAVFALASAPFASAQSLPAAPAAPKAPMHPAASPMAQAPSESDVADTQEQLLKLLRLSPVLTSVVARDPSLLSDQEYVARNNPELAQFLQAHPDVARNPEFYLFNHLENGHGRRDEALERAVWPDLVPPDHQSSSAADIFDRLQPIIIVPAIFFAFVWIVRLFVQSHRWNRAYKQQTELHARLIDKFGTSQDLAAYLETDAGQRFLMAAPMAAGDGAAQRMPNAVARVLTPLQLGIVFTLLGIGLLFLRNSGTDMETPMAVLGTLALMPGIGFILSAAVTWFLAKRLGLLPDKADVESTTATGSGPQFRP